MGELLNGWSFLWHLVNLIILYFGLRHFLYKPVKKFMDQREASYAKQRDDIARDREQAMSIKQTYEKKMKDAQEEAVRVVAERADLAERQATEVIDAANREAHAIIAQAERESVSERARNSENMRREIIDLSMEMAKRVLEREIKPDDHERLFDEFLNHVG